MVIDEFDGTLIDNEDGFEVDDSLPNSMSDQKTNSGFYVYFFELDTPFWPHLTNEYLGI